MSEERKPLTNMHMFRTINGGWVIRVGNSDYGRDEGTYSYSSDADMLDALPALIGVSGVESPSTPHTVRRSAAGKSAFGYETVG